MPRLPEPRHTPGPWRRNSSYRRAICTEEGTEVCVVTSGAAGGANTDLIVQAPELAACLADFLREWEGDQSPPRKVVNARAVLARAYGEPA